MFFVTHRKIIFSILAGLSVVSVALIAWWGVVFGIEFTGGTIVEVAYVGERPEKDALEERLSTLDLGQFSLRHSNEDGYILRLRDIKEDEYIRVREALSEPGTELVEKRRATVGPVIGEELKNKAFVAIAVVIVLIVFFVAFAFRRVRQEGEDEEDENAEEVSSWSYGLVAIVVLLHDILIPIAMFSLLGRFYGAEVDVLIVMALLTILGYSVNDTIIIFDRIRENVRENNAKKEQVTFAEVVGRSLEETYARSINTSLTTLMVVTALFVFGGPTTMYFALTLMAGVLAGTYSSIALAAPLLVVAKERKDKKNSEKV